MPEADLRFYEELNDFLPAERRRRTFSVEFEGTPSVKDVVERCGVPHPEVDLVLVDGKPVDWSARISGGERIAVYPVFESLDITEAQRLRPKPLRRTSFVVDANLGALARLLRLLGCDVLYDPDLDDAEIAERSRSGHRIVLTRDRELLKRSAVTHGVYVRSDDPEEQAAQVVARLDIADRLDPLSRCVRCGGPLVDADAEQVRAQVPPRSRNAYERFSRCASCGAVYWRGTHYAELEAKVERILARARRR